MKKRLIAIVLSVTFAFSMLPGVAFAADNPDVKPTQTPPTAQDYPASTSTQTVEPKAKSAILIDQDSGQVLYELNPDEVTAPASITKVMTMLLTMEAIEDGRIKLTDKVKTSQHAESMGGSQLWLEVGEEMTVDDLLKGVAVHSANDAAVCLAEHIAGTEGAFVEQMNKKAQALGMKSTKFVNCNGLDEDGHVTTARDVATMSRELLKHEQITKYTKIWMDVLRDGKMQIVNTNRLIRFYEGATGLKTGTTDKAGVCVSASAKRGNLHLIAVVMGAANSNDRFQMAQNMLDYGFANYTSVQPDISGVKLTPVKVLKGCEEQVGIVAEKPSSVIVKKGDDKKIVQKVTLSPDVMAPVEKGQVLGKIVLTLDGKTIGECKLKAEKAVPKMSFGRAFALLLQLFTQM